LEGPAAPYGTQQTNIIKSSSVNAKTTYIKQSRHKSKSYHPSETLKETEKTEEKENKIYP
jgi:hypothetical protein